jgi:protoporphyrinogen oxidase
MKPKDVVIIGGGIAGLTAAFQLVKRGREHGDRFRIRVLEAESETGGQARAFDVNGFMVEHGSHVFFNYYRTILGMIEELRADDEANPTSKMPGLSRVPGWTICDPYGRRVTLQQSPNLPLVLATLPSMLQIPWLTFWERIRLAWAAFKLMETPFSEYKELDKKSSYELGTDLGYSEVGAMTWNAASLGLTNLFVQEQSGALFAGKHRLLINQPDGLAYQLPAGDLSELFARPVTRKLLKLGVKITTNALVKSIDREFPSKRTRIDFTTPAGAESIEADHVILASSPWVAKTLVPWVTAPWTELGPVSPVITVVLRLSGRVKQSADDRELGCSREHWSFSVVTDLSQFWPEYAGDKTVIRCEIGHADRLAGGVDADKDALVAEIKRDLDRLFPEVVKMTVEKAELHRESKHLYTAWTKGQFAKKPEDRDVGKGVFLAGDWTSKGTIGMEAAANSGFEAANHVLAASMLPLAEYQDVPLV